ncbi:hypothetical protein, partial [Lentzea kentuckyensis]|uniref:hypothetical protein n=1 Tax=Lentzea kentuckyensis TaxID=360086 RepID=UPI001302AE1B
KTVAAHHLATSDGNTAMARALGSIKHEVLPSAPSPVPGSLYRAVDPANADRLRAKVLDVATGSQAKLVSEIGAFVQGHPIEHHGHLVNALVQHRTRSTDADPRENTRAGNADELAARLIATELKNNVVIHHPDGTSTVHEPFTGKAGRKPVHITHHVDADGRHTYEPGGPARTRPAPLDDADPGPSRTAPGDDGDVRPVKRPRLGDGDLAGPGHDEPSTSHEAQPTERPRFDDVVLHGPEVSVASLDEARVVHNAAFDELAPGPVRLPSKDDYLDLIAAGVDERKPVSFVVTAILGHGALKDLPAVLDGMLAGARDVEGKVAFVFGVNAKAGGEADLARSLEQAAPVVRSRTEPVALVPLVWEGKKFPYGDMRNQTIDSP